MKYALIILLFKGLVRDYEIQTSYKHNLVEKSLISS